jgi:hypothetical protein
VENYKAELAERYPQVCADCVVMVNKRLRDATYTAKTDHLRRLMDKTRSGEIKSVGKGWGLTHFTVLLGGLMWWTSLLLGLLWHGLGMLPPAEEQDRRPRVWYEQAMWCAANVGDWRTSGVPSSCYDPVARQVWLALYLAFFSGWWNPKIFSKLSSRTGRLRKVNQYLLLEAVVFAIRLAATYFLENYEPGLSDISRGTHFAMFIVLVISIYRLNTTIELKEKPLVSFTGLQPIIAAPSHPQTIIPTQDDLSSSFPISALSSNRARSPSPDQGYESSSLTSTTESTVTQINWGFDDDEDMAMEWTPTQTVKTLTPRRPIRDIAPKPFDSPSPFYGTLPPAPMPPAVKARRPLQPFIPASQEKKDDFFQKMTGENQGRGLDFGGTKRGDYSLQPPVMRDRRAETAETGLEHLFNSAFTIGGPEFMQQRRDPYASVGEEEEPVVPGFQRGHVYEGETIREGVIISRLLFGIVISIALGLACAWWVGPERRGMLML